MVLNFLNICLTFTLEMKWNQPWKWQPLNRLSIIQTGSRRGANAHLGKVWACNSSHQMPAQCSRCWLSIDCPHQFVQLFIVNPPLFHRGWLTGNINNWAGKKSRLVELTNLLRPAAQHVCCKPQSLSILYLIHQFGSDNFHNGRRSFENTFCHYKLIIVSDCNTVLL